MVQFSGARSATENWQYRHQPLRDYQLPILWNYVHYTFKRVEIETTQEGKEKLPVAVGRDKSEICCFNTGLVTEMQEPILAFFSKNRANQPTDPIWILQDFVRDSDSRLTYFKKIPEIATYFDDPINLIFDTRLDVRPDFQHFLDYPDRLPVGVRQKYPTDAEFIDQMRRSIDLAIRRVRRNYKTAIPQYHKGRLQLLLPLCILSPNHADAAMVLSRSNEVYLGETALSLDQAYNNARLIARPDTEWLDP